MASSMPSAVSDRAGSEASTPSSSSVSRSACPAASASLSRLSTSTRSSCSMVRARFSSICSLRASVNGTRIGAPARFAMMAFVAADRYSLRATFDSAAHLYHQSRPDYPEEWYHEWVRLAALRSGDRLLEIGCATGKATLPLARRGFRITWVEIGAELAAMARQNLAGFPDAEVIEGAFETCPPSPESGFNLVFAATAWHWIDPAVKDQRALGLLLPGGHLAVWSATH